MGGEISMRTAFAASALLVAALAWSNVSLAEGALAVGIPEGNPRNGFKWDARVDTPDAQRKGRGAACQLDGENSLLCDGAAK
jgi:hypothetical protein